MADPRDIRSDGSFYPVLEIFTSIQSEGARAGTLTNFLRLAGCNMKCPFCDTPMSPYEMLSADEIAERLLALTPRRTPLNNLVITGGEPLVHDLLPLMKELRRVFGFSLFIAMETNGSRLHRIVQGQPQVLDQIDWLTVSPKAPISGGLLREQANEVKYVVPDHEDLVDWQHGCVFVQPEYNNPESVQRCLYWMAKYPSVRMSVQMHKYIGLR